MRICLMIEGQEDISWDQWVALARTCEEAGFEALFRSDHYLSVAGRTERASLDAWATLPALAAITQRIRLGTLVSPATFRHPSVLAKMVATADHVSGGRIELGLGAGWYDREHHAYGFEFPDVRTRMERFAEQAEIVHRSWTQAGFTFVGTHYRVEDLDALPKPVQRPHPPLIIGGAAGPVSVGVAARWADEYNTLFVSPDECAARRARIAQAFEVAGRDPASLVFSLMTPCLVGSDDADLQKRAARIGADRGRAPNEVLERLAVGVTGTASAAIERLLSFREAGVGRVMLQHQDPRDLEMIKLIGAEIIPKVS